MNSLLQNILLIEGLTARAAQLEALLKERWPEYCTAVARIRTLVAAQAADAEITGALDDLVSLLLDSPAADLTREALKEIDPQEHAESVRGAAAGPPAPRAALDPEIGRLALAASVHAISVWAQPIPAEGYSTVPVFYGTDRGRTGKAEPQEFYGGRRGTLEFGIAAVSVPRRHKKGRLEAPAWWRRFAKPDPAVHMKLLDLAPLERGQFTARIREALRDATDRDVLVFIHGYNVAFAEAARRAAQIAYDLQFPGAAALYSWPSAGGFLKYVEDGNNAAWSVPDFCTFLRLLAAEFGRVHLLAHSMGNRLLFDGLRRLEQEEAAPPARFGEVVLAAPDIDSSVFRGGAAAFCRGARRCTLYASSGDHALRVSQFINGYPRVGDTREIVVVNGIDTIDASAVDTSLLGHSYFGDERSIMGDIFSLLRQGLPPWERFGLAPREANNLKYWAFSA